MIEYHETVENTGLPPTRSNLKFNDFIQGLQILYKYSNPSRPIHCDHETLFICVNPDRVSHKDIMKLSELGFFDNNDNDDRCFVSYRWGSA